ncbi:MAG: hypothetical protein KIT84_18555 [Labilithrix sp.]|nr:hypothetical protein [Labilithrix sp.]MCW5813036.1 hypothetical protein [Labilithrix sp.]
MSLSSLIVQRGVATIREIEEALARQVLYGGDFVTNLLEVSRVEEGALMPVVGEFYGLPAAPPGELPQPAGTALRIVAADVVQERTFVPLEAGASLVVAVAEPLSKEAEQELTFALALPIEQKVAPLFRIRQALARDYGIPIDKRIARLIQKVVTKGPIIASTFPPPLDSAPKIRVPPRPPSMIPPPVAPAPASPKMSVEPRTAAAPQGTYVREIEPQQARPPRRRRGPLTLAVAVEELEASVERDFIFDVLFEFTRQFFDYTALFVVQGDVAEGRDAFGDGAPRDKVARLAVPLDDEGILGGARKEKKPVRRRPSAVADAVLMTDLGRDGQTECIVFPIVVRTRVVSLILGDGGTSGIEDIGVRQVESLIDTAAGAFERVIMRRKLKGEAPSDAKGKKDTVPPPPTMVSEPAQQEDRISAEELAAPIREIMMEPPSKRHVVRLDPEPPISARPPLPIESGPPPPSGRPGATNPPRRRATAPSFEFGFKSEPSIVSESKRPEGLPVIHVHHASVPASDPVPNIHEAVTAPPPPSPRALETALETGNEAPSTTRDPVPGVSLPAHPWAEGVPPVSDAPHSPKAESPPPMRAAPITDVSPQPIQIGPISEAVPDFSEDQLATKVGHTTDPSPPSLDLPPSKPPPPVELAEPRTFVASEPLFDEEEAASFSQLVVQNLDQDADMPVFDPEATPVAPTVIEGETPAAPAVLRSEPVLALSTRKGDAPLPIPSFQQKPMPPSEGQVSVGPHHPPSSHSDHSRVLPSVIVDVSSEYVGLVERAIAGEDEEAEAQLLRAGGYAMPAIMAKFPGPITIEAERLDLDALPRVADCGPVIRLIASQRRTALPFVLAHVEAPDAESRFWATYLLTELVYPDAIDAAIARAFDDDAKVRRAARAAVHALAESHPQAVVERLGELTLAQTVDLRIRAIEALAETREPSAVQVLLPLLDENDSEVAIATQKGLVLLTRQDFGLDLEKWTAWWDANKGRHRLEWLMDSLMHEQRRIRGLAGEELKWITKESFGYYDDLPRRERERSQQRFRDWWEHVGRVRFSRAATRGA